MAPSLLEHFTSSLATPCLVDRETGQRITELAPLGKAVRIWFLYQTWIGRLILMLPFTWWILHWQHHRIAKHANSPKSKKDIPSMIQTYGIDVSAAEKPVVQYSTLQEFFTRRLKPGLRPLAEPEDDAVAVMPADSRCVVYDSVDAAHRFWIKGQHFNVHKLMGPGYDTQDHWKHAAISINRLSPADIHRLHAAVSGRVVRIRSRGNKFMASQMDIMVENERLVMEFESLDFGTVVQVMIGASQVGTVVPLVNEGQVVKKGDEVAVFEYGGSIMATLFHQGSISFDEDLEKHSKHGCETLVKFGSSMGRATHAHTGPAAQPPAGAET